MPVPFEFDGLDWKSAGYHGVALPANWKSVPLASSPWLEWLVACSRAKEGNFSHVLELLVRSIDSRDPVFVQLCHDLLGDAGPGPCFPAIREAIREDTDPDFVLSACNILAERGELADVPLLLDTFIENAANKDAAILCVYLSDLLEAGSELGDTDSFASVDDYAAAVRKKHDELVQALGSEHALVFQGEPFSVVRLSEIVLDALRQPYFRMSFRRRFEAATGINCTAFYDKRNLQPLAAADIIETFLHSPAAAKFENGVRYFFGHRLPE